MDFKNNSGFSLIELLVWISISTILMLSVWYLISWWIKNITSQEKVLQNSSDISSFQKTIQNIFLNIDTSFSPIKTASWVIVRIKQNYDQWGFAYIWETTQDKLYCWSWSKETKTKHIFIKTFIPDFDIDIQKAHKIDWVWKWFFWTPLTPLSGGKDANKVYLNNPTWSGSNWSIEFISDTLNNRILYKSGSKTYELLNENDWLLEPTWLLFDNWNLYIANSGKWEILKYSSKTKTNIPVLILTWITDTINSFEISFYNTNWNYDIQNSTNISDINFTNYSKQSWDSISINNNKLTYSFSGWINQNLNNETISINNLTNFTETWSYFVKLDINNKFYSFFIQSDDNLFTKNDNSLEIYKKNLKYPTKFNWNKDNIKEYLNPEPTSNLIFNKKYDYILKSPIKKLDINYNTSKKILNLELDYYKKYNCYNLEEKTSSKFILKKNYSHP